MAAPVQTTKETLIVPRRPLEKASSSVVCIFSIAKILFVGKANVRQNFKIAQERTSFWPTARRASARRAVRIPRTKTSGRLCEPPTKWH